MWQQHQKQHRRRPWQQPGHKRGKTYLRGMRSLIGRCHGTRNFTQQPGNTTAKGAGVGGFLALSACLAAPTPARRGRIVPQNHPEPARAGQRGHCAASVPGHLGSVKGRVSQFPARRCWRRTDHFLPLNCAICDEAKLDLKYSARRFIAGVNWAPLRHAMPTSMVGISTSVETVSRRLPSKDHGRYTVSDKIATPCPFATIDLHASTDGVLSCVLGR